MDILFLREPEASGGAAEGLGSESRLLQELQDTLGQLKQALHAALLVGTAKGSMQLMPAGLMAHCRRHRRHLPLLNACSCSCVPCCRVRAATARRQGSG